MYLRVSISIPPHRHNVKDVYAWLSRSQQLTRGYAIFESSTTGENCTLLLDDGMKRGRQTSPVPARQALVRRRDLRRVAAGVTRRQITHD